MKQILAFAFLMFAIMHTSYAQETKNYTMKVWSNGTYTSYQVEQVDSVTFCSNDSDDITPGNQTTEESLFQSENDVKAVLLASYQKFQSFITYERRLEELAINGGNEKITPNSSTVNQAWTNGYNAISYCNRLIDVTATMDNAGFDVKKYQTHAKFLRAVTYYMMTQLWGNIPYIQSSSMDDAMNPKIGNRQEIINESYYYIKFNLDDLVDLFQSQVNVINPTNLRPLLNEISFYVEGALYEDVPIHTDFIMNLDNDQGTYPIVDATYNHLIGLEYTKSVNNGELSILWKDKMPRYGVWNALKRLGDIAPDKVILSNTGMAPCLLFPIPQNELYMNQNLKQNEGY